MNFERKTADSSRAGGLTAFINVCLRCILVALFIKHLQIRTILILEYREPTGEPLGFLKE